MSTDEGGRQVGRSPSSADGRGDRGDWDDWDDGSDLDPGAPPVIEPDLLWIESVTDRLLAGRGTDWPGPGPHDAGGPLDPPGRRSPPRSYVAPVPPPEPAQDRRPDLQPPSVIDLDAGGYDLVEGLPVRSGGPWEAPIGYGPLALPPPPEEPEDSGAAASAHDLLRSGSLLAELLGTTDEDPAPLDPPEPRAWFDRPVAQDPTPPFDAAGATDAPRAEPAAPSGSSPPARGDALPADVAAPPRREDPLGDPNWTPVDEPPLGPAPWSHLGLPPRDPEPANVPSPSAPPVVAPPPGPPAGAAQRPATAPIDVPSQGHPGPAARPTATPAPGPAPVRSQPAGPAPQEQPPDRPQEQPPDLRSPLPAPRRPPGAQTALRLAFRSGDHELADAVVGLVAEQSRDRERLRTMQMYLDALLAEGATALPGAARLRRLLGD